MHVTLGSRVYYKDNGPDDTGTIIDILLDDYPFVVKWDRQELSHWVKREFFIPELMDKPYKFEVNPADENIDCFRGSQLCAVSE